MFLSNLSHYGGLCSEMHICLFELKCYLFGSKDCLQSLIPFWCIRIHTEWVFSLQKNYFCVYWTRLKARRINPKPKGDLLSDFDSVLLTLVMGNHQLLGTRTAFALSPFSPPNILLIDFRETVSGCADEVIHLAKVARCESQISLFLLVWFVVLCADESGRVEDFNYSQKVKKVVEVLEIQHRLVATWRLHPFGM